MLDRDDVRARGGDLAALARERRSSSSTTSCRTIASTPAEALAWLDDRLETAEEPPVASAPTSAAQERIELIEAGDASTASSRRELGVIDFGDQIDRAIEIVTRFPDVVADHRARFQAVLLDEYQDTNVAQAELMAALFGGGHPVTAVGDPDQNIYAWRGASLYNLFRFPERLPAGRRHARRAAAAVHELPLGRADPGRRRHGDRAGARGAAAAGQAARPVGGQRAGRGADPPGARRVDRGAARSPTGASSCTTAGSAWSEMAVLCRTSRLFGLLRQAFDERGVPVEIVGLAGLLKHARGGRGARVRPRGARPDGERGARADPARARATASGSRTSRCSPGWPRSRPTQLREAYDMEDDDVEAEPVLLAEALEHLEEVEELSEEGASTARRVPRGAPRAARRGATPGRASSSAR